MALYVVSTWQSKAAIRPRPYSGVPIGLHDDSGLMPNATFLDHCESSYSVADCKALGLSHPSDEKTVRWPWARRDGLVWM
jgi:hypothetical protein